MIVKNQTPFIALCLALPLLAGCAGGTASSPGGSLPAGSAALGGLLPQDNRGCQNDGGISVSPCFVKFTASNPGPVQVVVRQNSGGGGSRDRIRERDDCASGNIATIVRDSRGHYTVTAGSVTGSCNAQFDSTGDRNNDGGQGSGGGGGNLQIVNRT